MNALGRTRNELSPLSPLFSGLSPQPAGTDFSNGDNGLGRLSTVVPAVPAKKYLEPRAEQAKAPGNPPGNRPVPRFFVAAGLGFLFFCPCFMHWSAWGRGGEKVWTTVLETDLFLKFLRAQVSGGGGTPRARWCMRSWPNGGDQALRLAQ